MNYEYRALCVKVYDGDTITCDIDLGFYITLRKQTIRLLSIDTPEIRGDERPEGLIAKDWLAEQILNKEVVLHTLKDKRGKYGRWLADVYLPESDISLNKTMLDLGIAKKYQ